MLKNLEQILHAANPCYRVMYQESAMMNIKADQLKETASYVHIEEFRRGSYVESRFGPLQKQMTIQIYFSKFTPMQNDAIEREKLRHIIELEIVQPFIREYKKSASFVPVTTWTVNYPMPRFDANEVSVMLEFNCQSNIC